MYKSRFDILLSDCMEMHSLDEDDQDEEETVEVESVDDKPKVKKRPYASGVLPISFVNGKCVFLLGEDLKSGFSDLGGKAERYDTSSAECAAREFYEETLGQSIGNKQMLQRLQSRAILLEGRTANQYKYIMFVTEIPFDASLSKYFKRAIAFLKSRGLAKMHVEKKTLRWFTLQEMLEAPKRKVFENTLLQNMETITEIGQCTPSSWNEMCRRVNTN